MLRVFRAVANANIRLGRGLDSIKAHRPDGKDQFLTPRTPLLSELSCRPRPFRVVCDRHQWMDSWSSTQGFAPAQKPKRPGHCGLWAFELSFVRSIGDCGDAQPYQIAFCGAAILGHCIIYRADTTTFAPGKLRLFHIADRVAGLPLKRTLGLMSVMCAPPAFSPTSCSGRAVRVSLSMGQAACTPSP